MDLLALDALPLALRVTGLPAVIIILVILALIMLGIVTVIRAGKRGVDEVTHKDHR